MLRPGIAHVPFCCSLGHYWIVPMAYYPATGSFRTLIEDAELCPQCGLLDAQIARETLAKDVTANIGKEDLLP